MVKNLNKSKETKNIDEQFIYTFKIRNIKSTQRKTKIDYAIKVFNKFITQYMYLNKQIDYNFPMLEIKDTKIEHSKDETLYIIHVITIPYINHPFTIFGKYDENLLYIMIPLGNNLGQININKISKKIAEMPTIHKLGTFFLLNFTIKIRKQNFLKPYKNELFTCGNIIKCNEKMNKINLLNINITEKYKKINEIHKIYIDKIKIHLKKYFELCKEKKYYEAKKYLNEGKDCLKQYYYNSKNIIGHLLIFINIYKCIDNLKKSI